MKIEPDDEYNRELVAQVHPDEWVNPTPDGAYNIVVIGGGTAGLVTAAGAAGLGARVPLIERRFLGGDCLNFGCVPSKALLRAARAVGEIRHAATLGIQTGEPTVDFGAVMERMRRLRAEISHHDSASRFQDLGVDVYLGEAEFSEAGKIRVGDDLVEYSKAVIATGASPFVPPIPGLDDVDVHTNETIFELTELPERLAVIGAGPIGCELAQAFGRFGSTVHLFEAVDRVLRNEDPRASEVLLGALERDGVHVHLETAVEKVDDADGSIRIHSESADPIVVDELLIAVGRAPNVSGLGLDAVGVAYGKRGVEVDDRLQTSNVDIFAAGDVASKYQFTHVADFQARIVIQNALFFGRKKASELVVPWCTFTDPEIARVGLTEAEAAEQGVDVDVYSDEFADVDRAILDGATEGFVKLLTRKGSDRIVGATIVAPHAGEMIGEVTLAMNHRLGLGAIAETIHPYPTQAEALRRIGDQYNRTRLSPRIKSTFETFLSWRR